MNRAFFLRAICLVSLLSASATARADGDAMNLPLDPAPLTIITGEAVIDFKIEVADDHEERARGLMFRERLPEGQGMLFVFGEDDVQNFWMHNTPQPLDIIYIESDGDIESIHHAKALDDTPIPSGGPVRFVLEIASGEADRLGLKPGDKASHPLIEAAAPKSP